MSKKIELLSEAKKLKLEVSAKNTIAEIEKAIKGAKNNGATEKVSKNTSKTGNKEVEETSEAKSKSESKDSVVVTAKAGKRSAKALSEAEEKAVKEEKKTKSSEESEKPTKPSYIQKTRSKLERSSKKYRQVSELIEVDKEYSTKEALETIIKTSTTKFDSSVEIHVRLGVDPKQADQNIRETIVLPAGTGKNVKVAVFGEPEEVVAAKKAGADIAGSEEFLQQLDKGVIDFDVLIASPKVMAKLGKYARVLGPKGLMPNPKSGTVTTDITKAVQQAKAGKVEFRVDEHGIIHLSVGKVSFGADKLYENVQAVFASIKGAKPSGIKGNFVETIYFTTTMGPSIKVLSSEL